jgi:hypothetical protein
MSKFKISLLFIFFLFSLNCLSQNDTISIDSKETVTIFDVCKQLEGDTLLFFFDSRYYLVKPECAEIFRKVKIDTTIGFYSGDFIDFYKNGSIALIGNYTNGKKEGAFSFYFPNGILEAKGEYKNNIKYGQWDYYYDNGLNHQKLDFKNNDTLILDFWNENNEKLVDNGNGRWYTYKTYFNSTKIEGQVVNGKKDGKWTYSSTLHHYTLNAEKYKEGKLIIGKFTDYYNQTIRYKNNPVCKIEFPLAFTDGEYFRISKCYSPVGTDLIEPSYPGGMDVFYKEVKSKFKFPESAITANIKGTIMIRLSISDTGAITKCQKISDLGYGLEDEFIRVIRTMGNWIPAKLNNKPSNYTKIVALTIQ